MTRWLFAAIVASVLAAPALGDRPKRGLQKYDGETTETRDVNRRPSKVGVWVEDPDSQPQDWSFPWMPVLGTLLCFGIAAPFAWRLYRNVNDEIAANKTEPDQPPPVRVRRKLTTERQ